MENERPFDDKEEQLLAGYPDELQAAIRAGLRMPPADFAANYYYEGPLEGALDYLTLFDRDHARAVYDAMVSHPVEETRMQLTNVVDVIVRHDYGYGYALWNRLLGDPSRSVRHYAHEILEGHLSECQSSGETLDNVLVDIDLLGRLTWRDTTNLLRTYVEAEIDGVTCELGAVALTAPDAVPPTTPDVQALRRGSTKT